MMTRDFTWNIQVRPQALELAGAGQAAAEAAQGAREYADRMAARSMGLQSLPGTTLGQARAALDAKASDEAVRASDEAVRASDEAVRASELQELAELQARRDRRMSSPEWKLAAMLAMAGQPGSLQSMLMGNSRGESGGDAQGTLDTLEREIANDMFALAGADEDTYSKLTMGLVPLYRNKWEELVARGGKSRFAPDWESGWGSVFTEMGRTRRRRKANADKKKNEKSTLRNL